MKLKNKGFTLVELLAMMIVLGILMAVTVPNISGILNSHKTNVIEEDISKMVDKAKIKISTDRKISNPKNNNNCVIFTLKNLNDSDDFKKGPNSGSYNQDESFVIIKRINSSYKYYLRLVENSEDGKYGVSDAEYDDFLKNSSKLVGEITDEVNLGGLTIYQAANVNQVKKYCSSVEAIHNT